MTAAAHWYALKVFYNKVLELKGRLEGEGFECYCPLDVAGRPLVASLLFVRCEEARIVEFRHGVMEDSAFLIYTHKELRKSPLDGARAEVDVPTPIPEREMEAFILVTSAEPGMLEVLGPDDPKYHAGQKVRVREGVFAGAEGYVRRIKKDRRLVITVTGVVAVATFHISPSLLEPV